MLSSERVIISAPLSYAGSGARIWRLARRPTSRTLAHVGLVTAAVVLVIAAWILVTAWYVVWGLLLVPYRLVRRGQRKRRRDELRHRELLAAVDENPRPS